MKIIPVKIIPFIMYLDTSSVYRTKRLHKLGRHEKNKNTSVKVIFPGRVNFHSR